MSSVRYHINRVFLMKCKSNIPAGPHHTTSHVSILVTDATLLIGSNEEKVAAVIVEIGYIAAAVLPQSQIDPSHLPGGVIMKTDI